MVGSVPDNRRLNAAVLALFALALVCIALAGIAVDIHGYKAVSKQLEERLEASVQLLAHRLQVANREDDPFALSELYSTMDLGETIVASVGNHVLWQRTFPVRSPESPWSWVEKSTRGVRFLWLRPVDVKIAYQESSRSVLYEGTIPSAAVLDSSSYLFPGIVLSLLSSALLVALFVLVRVAVLRRVMLLATAAHAIETGQRQSLPYERSRDEIGMLARALSSLVAELHKRNEQERLRLKTIGHHIRSPLQALQALNPYGTPSWSYIDRMEKAITAIYGADDLRSGFCEIYGSPSELDLVMHLREACDNAPLSGIFGVRFICEIDHCYVHIDSGALDDALMQVLNNAMRHRRAETAIAIRLDVSDLNAQISIENEGEKIPPDSLEKIFEFGVSLTGNQTNNGQGLYVARQFLSMMGGTIGARNTDTGVAFDLHLPLLVASSSESRSSLPPKDLAERTVYGAYDSKVSRRDP